MTVVTLLPITLVFAFLQRFITSGIASTGMKSPRTIQQPHVDKEETWPRRNISR